MNSMLRQKVHKSIHAMINDENKSTNVEKSIYNFAIKTTKTIGLEPSWDDFTFCHVYKQKYLDIMINLKGPLLNMITSNTILSRDVAYLSPQELDPAKWEPNEDINTDDVVEGIFKCKRCGSKRTTYYSLQTRSSDEPMTNFITCVECHNRWKM
jgi:DNA-directed RNA polymerase subunit M/transcription elongation factor TFIIS